MPISAKLREYLDDNNIKYVIISHSRAYTAQEVAQSVHVPGKELAKAVIVKLDGKSIRLYSLNERHREMSSIKRYADVTQL